MIGAMYYFVGVLLLLGILIFIHEFGHFYVAKLCGMKVETFSIGMGHKIFRYRRGETEYVLSWIPFGGYVKILGQDPREEIPPADAHRSFSKMSLWKRFAVVIAGPAANFILAFFVFWLLFAKGFPSPSSTVQFVQPDSPAALAGLRAGDKIVSVQVGSGASEVPIRELQDLQRVFRLQTASSVHVGVERKGEVIKLEIPAVQGKFMDPMTGLDRDSLTLPGLEFQSYPPLYGVVPASPLSKVVSDSYFLVESVELGSEKISTDSAHHFVEALQRASSSGETLKLSIRSIGLDKESAENTKISEPKTVSLKAGFGDQLSNYGFVPAHLLVTQILPGSAAEKLGLQSGDILSGLNGKPVWTFSQFRKELQELASQGGALELTWIRNGTGMSGQFTPQHVNHENPITQVTEKKFQLGAMFAGFADVSFEKVQAKSLGDGIALAWKKTWSMSVSIVESFKLLLTGQVSVKAMGGPVMIGKIAGDSLRLGLDYFLKMLAFISLNLAIMNLLPLPVLDGGHIVLFIMEGLARRPMPLKFIEAWATTGFFFLIGLALFVTFNDLAKLNVAGPLLQLFGK